MPASPYATVDDLNALLGETPPAGSQRLLANAQRLLDAALKSSFYATDANGNPTDSAVAAALKDAACFQAEWWIRTGDEFGQSARFASYSIEGISVTRDTSAVARSRLCDRSREALEGVIGASTVSARPLLPGKPVV